MSTTSQSEIARLRQQIELECQALQRLLHDPTMVASHSIITHKYQSLGQHINELSEVVGVDTATEIATGIYGQFLG